MLKFDDLKRVDSILQGLEEDTDESAILDYEVYQKELFKEYILRNNEHKEKRQKLLKRFLEGEPLYGPKGIRKELAAFDLAYFGRAYLPSYFVRKSPVFHEELDRIWTQGVLKEKDPFSEAKAIARLDGSRQAIAAPRGHAKSTNFTFKGALHAAVYAYKHYILLLSDSSEQAEEFLEKIKAELESNVDLILDFGILKGDKKWSTSVIITKNNVKIQAIGSGKKVRGRGHKSWRPDLIILDDVENDENVNTPEQRKKLKSWFDKAVSSAGDTYTDIMYIGTILHYDSLLTKTLHNSRYQSRKYQAVISFATNQKLWEEWEQIYNNLMDNDRQQNALTFFEANKVEMLAGTKVLWEDKLPYYKLMEAKLEFGEAAFNSELQNEPIDPGSAVFNEEWFDFYNEELLDFSKPNYLLIGSNDPSLGKNQKSDTSAIISIALDTITGYMYVVEASIEKRKPDVIITDIIETNRRFKVDYKKPYYKFGVEIVQFQLFFKDVLAAKSVECGEYIPIEEISSLQNKNLRIESLQPVIKNKYLKFKENQKELLKQLKEYPMGRNDDGPDGLHMVVTLAQSIKANKSFGTYKSVSRRKIRFRKGAY